MKKNRITCLILILFIVSVLYISFPLIVQPDSIGYYQYLEILNGFKPFSEWNVVRGPTLPIILFFITKIFGNSHNGILFGTYLFFMMFNTLYLKIIVELLKQTNNKFRKIIIVVISLIFILFNPIIYGYFRTLMTEFVAFPLILLNCILCNRWINSKKTIAYITIFSIISVISWFLKQQYLIIILSSIFIAFIISLFIKLKENIIKKSITIVIVFVSVIISIWGWKTFLINQGVDYNNGANSNHYLTNAIMLGNTNVKIYHEKNSLTVNDVVNDIHINNIDKNKIINILSNNINENFDIFSIQESDGTVKYKVVLFYKGSRVPTIDAIKFWVKVLINEPKISLNAYTANYLATINLYTSVRDGYGNYAPDHRLVYYNHENYFAALWHTQSIDNFLWMRDDIVEPVKNLKVNNNAPQVLKTIINKVSFFGLESFKFLFLILPILFIYSLVVFFRRIKKYNNLKYETLTIILFGTSLIYMIFLSFTGAIIDRYAYVVYPEVVLGCSILISLKKGSIKMEKNLKKNINKNNKILFVIPAYNEAENIEKVLKEIKKDVNYADILVINDCSKDNTKEIVEKNAVKCITNIFNMRYAMAVQTGIKYAYENDYDFVIQFDADGQHIAKEAVKMIEKQKETDCDIVIGSRYLVDTGYPCPFFRRIGTKFFSFLINLFCKKKIADPLSGFQLLNRNVIEYYSKMGKYPEFPDANLVMEMLYQGYKIEEVPVKMRLRETGESMHGGIIKPIKYMIKIFYTICFIVIKNIGRKVDDK